MKTGFMLATLLRNLLISATCMRSPWLPPGTYVKLDLRALSALGRQVTIAQDMPAIIRGTPY